MDTIIVGGDFNSRIGHKLDHIHDVGYLPKRCVLDRSCNNHGDAIIELLKESKMCTLNDKSEQDDYTLNMFTKGRSVVDYMLVPHDNLNSYQSFKVLSCTVDKINLQRMIHSRCNIPDHYMLS